MSEIAAILAANAIILNIVPSLLSFKKRKHSCCVFIFQKRSLPNNRLVIKFVKQLILIEQFISHQEQHFRVGKAHSISLSKTERFSGSSHRTQIIYSIIPCPPENQNLSQKQNQHYPEKASHLHWQCLKKLPPEL